MTLKHFLFIFSNISGLFWLSLQKFRHLQTLQGKQLNSNIHSILDLSNRIVNNKPFDIRSNFNLNYPITDKARHLYAFHIFSFLLSSISVILRNDKRVLIGKSWHLLSRRRRNSHACSQSLQWKNLLCLFFLRSKLSFIDCWIHTKIAQAWFWKQHIAITIWKEVHLNWSKWFAFYWIAPKKHKMMWN